MVRWVAGLQREQRTNPKDPLGTVTDIIFQFPATWSRTDATRYLERTIPGLFVELLKQAGEEDGAQDAGEESPVGHCGCGGGGLFDVAVGGAQ